ncbi:MAG TPA: zf-HC2 domain-containing protein [Armatimonadota bacterium]|nr:zf-HC2 domain-containing protein [Armatimonadota bacterium]
MDCSHVRPLLDEYFEGVLPERRETEVAGHIAACPDCAAELRQIEMVAAALEAVPRVAPAAHLLRTISLRAAELPAPAARRTAAGWRWLALVAAVSMAALALVSYLLPLLVSEGLASEVPLARYAEDGAVVLRSWLTAAPGVLVALWTELAAVSRGCVLAVRAAAPTLGLYAAAEIGILMALVLVLHASRRKRRAPQIMLV